MKEKQLSEHESLQLIQQMIGIAKKEQKDDGRGWIVWGWMLFVASLLTVVNLHTRWFSNFFFWNALGMVAAVAFIYDVVSTLAKKKTVRVKTYTGDLFSRLNAGFFISLIFIIVSINVGTNVLPKNFGSGHAVIINTGFALLINLYAFWILIYGTALSFRPSVIGAYGTWAIGFAALFVQDFEMVMLLHALAVLIGYIIPGHIASREFKKFKEADKVIERV